MRTMIDDKPMFRIVVRRWDREKTDPIVDAEYRYVWWVAWRLNGPLGFAVADYVMYRTGKEALAHAALLSDNEVVRGMVNLGGAGKTFSAPTSSNCRRENSMDDETQSMTLETIEKFNKKVLAWREAVHPMYRCPSPHLRSAPVCTFGSAHTGEVCSKLSHVSLSNFSDGTVTDTIETRGPA